LKKAGFFFVTVLFLMMILIGCTPTLLPDLTVLNIANIGVNCPTGAGSCVTTVTFTIANTGQENAGPFTVRVVADPSASQIENVNVTGLNAGATKTLTVNFAPNGNCFDPDCSVVVIVDVNSNIVESDEGNNQLTDLIIG